MIWSHLFKRNSTDTEKFRIVEDAVENEITKLKRAIVRLEARVLELEAKAK
jgi:hypothetical protein